MVDIPRALTAVPGDPFPDEWNKAVSCLRLLDQLGTFRRGAPSASRVIAEFILQDDLYRGVTDDKVVGRLVSWDGEDLVESSPEVELDIYGDRFGGFAFEGEIVRAELCGKNGRWYAIGAGHTCLRCTLGATLTAGGTAAGTATDLEDTPAMTVKDYVLGSGQSIASGKTFHAAWDSGVKKWVLAIVKCADVTG